MFGASRCAERDWESAEYPRTAHDYAAKAHDIVRRLICLLNREPVRSGGREHMLREN